MQRRKALLVRRDQCCGAFLLNEIEDGETESFRIGFFTTREQSTKISHTFPTLSGFNMKLARQDRSRWENLGLLQHGNLASDCTSPRIGEINAIVVADHKPKFTINLSGDHERARRDTCNVVRRERAIQPGDPTLVACQQVDEPWVVDHDVVRAAAKC